MLKFKSIDCLDFSVNVIYFILLFVGGVVKDQATADEDTSLKDRGLIAISKWV